MPKNLWSEALMCATFQLNRCPSRSINYKIPAQVYYGNENVNTNRLKVFGSKAGMYVSPKIRNERTEHKKLLWLATVIMAIDYGTQIQKK